MSGEASLQLDLSAALLYVSLVLGSLNGIDLVQPLPVLRIPCFGQVRARYLLEDL